MFKQGVVLAVLAVSLAAAPVAMARDSDHDGLPNGWEKGKTPQGLNLKKLGANPKHRDVFVELEYSKQTGANEVQCSGLNELVKAFASGPLANPDGKQGIRLHIDAGKTCGSHDYDMGGSSTFKVNNSGCVSPLDFANTLAAKRLPVFHIGAVVADAQICGAEGTASGADFDVKINGGGNFFGYVVMHELGHVFGLDHGPFNGFSVMSGGAYRFGDNSGDSVLDYLRYPIQAMDESSLDEHTGFQTGSADGQAWLAQFYAPQYCGASLFHDGQASGPVDWDCDGAPFYMPPYSQYIDVNPVSYDINGDGTIGTIPAVPAEWPTVGHNLGNDRIGG